MSRTVALVLHLCQALMFGLIEGSCVVLSACALRLSQDVVLVQEHGVGFRQRYTWGRTALTPGVPGLHFGGMLW